MWFDIVDSIDFLPYNFNIKYFYIFDFLRRFEYMYFYEQDNINSNSLKQVFNTVYYDSTYNKRCALLWSVR